MFPFSLPRLEIQHIEWKETGVTITAHATSPTAICPVCQQVSHRLHSYYTHCPADLPVGGQAVSLSLQVRRFRCQNPGCRKQTFVEPLPETVARYARQTKRFRTTLKLFAIPLCGQAGSRLLNQVGMAVSGETLLRLAKEAGVPVVEVKQMFRLTFDQHTSSYLHLTRDWYALLVSSHLFCIIGLVSMLHCLNTKKAMIYDNRTVFSILLCAEIISNGPSSSSRSAMLLVQVLNSPEAFLFLQKHSSSSRLWENSC